MVFRVFGLTGGIGSGKSTVAQVFRSRGLSVVNADDLARAAVAPGSGVLQQIAQQFGQAIVHADGTLDRAALGAIVFKEPARRAQLNAIVHPEVRRLAAQAFAALRERGEVLCCYEVPLLFETGLADQYRPVVLVALPAEQQAQRIATRDQLSLDAAQSRIAAQLPLAEKLKGADYVIDNSGPPELTIQQAHSVLSAICAQLDIPSNRYAQPQH